MYGTTAMSHESVPSRDNLPVEIIDSFDDLVWSLALPDLTPLYFNAAAAKAYQGDREELLANSQLWLEAIAVEDQIKMQEAIAQALVSGKSYLNYRLQRSSGEICWFSARLKVVQDATGLPIRLDAIATEINTISDRQNSDDAIQNLTNNHRQTNPKIYIEGVILQNESNYRQIVEQQTDLILRSLADTTITFANEALCQMLGSSREDVIGKKWIDFAASDDLQNIMDSLSILNPEQSSFIGVNRDHRPNNQIGWTQWINQGIFNAQGELIEIQSVGRDITALKLSELALNQLNEELEMRIEQRTADLRESESRNRAILQALPDLLLLLKPDGTCVQCIMPTTYDKSKYVPIKHHISEVLTTETLTAQLQLYEKAIATGEVQIYEHQITKFGKTLYEEVRIAPYSEDELLVIVRDVTDRKLAEAQLLKSDRHLKTAQRIGKLGSWEYEINTGHLTWSDEVFRIYGLEPSNHPPDYEQLKLYIHPEDWEHFDRTVQAAMELGQPYDLEHRIIQPNGALIYVTARGETIYDTSNQLTHIIGTAIDITDRKLAEAKILETSQKLANTNRELESFCYSVSHDLRAPLRHINGFVNALRQQIQKHEELQDPKVDHYLQVIDSSSQKMGNLIDGLLVLSRYGRKPLDAKPVSIRELIDDAIEVLSSDPKHNPNLEFVIGELPNTIGDPTLLQQLFRNLISNAVKFSRNQPNPRIEIDSLPDQTIRIKDNGVGFQMEYADKLFGVFQRLHNEQDFEGTGIGLAIVQRIAQRHGGSVWAESSPNQGATFFVKI